MEILRYSFVEEDENIYFKIDYQHPRILERCRTNYGGLVYAKQVEDYRVFIKCAVMPGVYFASSLGCIEISLKRTDSELGNSIAHVGSNCSSTRRYVHLMDMALRSFIRKVSDIEKIGDIFHDGSFN